jgi:hypothetical protein
MTYGILLLLALPTVTPLFSQKQNPTPPPFFKGDRGKDDDEKTRSVQGTVSDPNEKPVEGAVVQLKNRKTEQVLSFITRSDGSYYFYGLSTDIDYELKAEHNNLASQRRVLSTFDNRKRAIINLRLEPKEEAESDKNADNRTWHSFNLTLSGGDRIEPGDPEGAWGCSGDQRPTA